MKKFLGAALILTVCGTAFAADGISFSPAFDVEVSLTKDTQIESNTTKLVKHQIQIMFCLSILKAA